MKKIIAAAGLIAFSDAALAHTGLLPSGGGFSQGFQHPFLGLDHFLAMLGLGLWASSQSRLLARQAIGAFLSFMMVGALFGLAGFGFAYVETAILISLLLVGVALSFGTTLIVPTRCVPNSQQDVGRDSRRSAPILHSHAARGNEVSFYDKAIILTSIAAFASMHGLAHGSEMPVNASAYAYIGGFVSATAVLHVSGLVLGWTAQRINAAGLIHIYGTLTGLTGAWLLLA
ncbi:HupE/UreJ family protein [Candidatus Methylobacter oryzae]|uniref:HupE/UreJ family protein n=1 Tax=Candidatus Methylobacter oryzae TaxID=2497749 RepID=A0ABY3C4Y7_9GAMM|nr:HupE/UreJ family protein [Candidatus Methylobacter oryzae]TRW89759.1 HupE/UreJ family protein [Candidatus Methylobacter oryzae]